jgi:hypothetical protein
MTVALSRTQVNNIEMKKVVIMAILAVSALNSVLAQHDNRLFAR